MAGMQIASLFASIGADTSGLQKGLKDSESQIKTTANSLKGFGSELARQVVGTVGLATAVYKVGRAVIESTVNWADYADTMRLSAQMSGITVEEMSRLVQAADDFRVPIETMQRSMEMALKNGFVPTIENIATLSDKLIGISDPAARAAAASDIFGKSYADMMPFLMAGGDAIRTTTDDIADNLIVTEEAARQAKEYADALDNMGDAWTGLQNTLGQFLVPAATNFFTELTNDLQQFVLEAELLSTANKALGEQRIGLTEFWDAVRLGEDVKSPTYIEDVNEAILDLNLLMGENTPRVRAFRAEQAALGDEILKQSDSWEQYRTELKAAGIEEFVSEPAWQAEKALSDMGKMAESIAPKIPKAMQLAGAAIEDLTSQLADAEINLSVAVQTFYEGVGSSVYQGLKDAGLEGEELEKRLKFFDELAGTDLSLQYKLEVETDQLVKDLLDPNFEVNFSTKFSEFDEYFQPLITEIQSAQTEVNELQNKINALEGIYKIQIRIITTGGLPDFGGGGGGGSAGYIPAEPELRATGGYSLAGQPYLVGEAGPELFIPDTNGRVYSKASSETMLGSTVTNNYNLVMPTTANPADIKIAFELMEAWNG